MTPKLSLTRTGSRYLQAPLLAILLTTSALAQEAPPAAPIPVENAPKPEEKKNEEVVTLSPFQVQTGKDAGYFAENTLAGSRLNSNIADLASSITVVTKQQMEDTASLDLNDVFKYEANTEGSSSYTPQILDRGTAKDAVAGYSFGNDGSASTNATSNRIRGLSAADSSMNYYAASARVPFDVYNIGSIEISRGPNSLLFGMGSPAGVVNQNLQQALLNRNTNNVSARFDALGSYRGSLAFNRVLIPDKLAIHVAALYDNQQFERQPSYDLKRRQYAALTFKPFKKTTLRGFAENFVNNANRPNFITPRDFVTPWLQSGRPAYDPIARTITKLDTNQTYGPYTLSTLSPGYVPGVPASALALTATTSPFYVTGIQFADQTRPVMRIDDGTLVDWFQRQPVAVVPAFGQAALPTTAQMNANPALWAINERQWTSSNGLPVPAGYASYQYAGVTNKSIYDWTKYNINQNNFGYLRAGNFNLELEQEILPNLFFNAGWLRQDIDAVDNYTVSQLVGATLTVDTNTKLPNGAANPYFGLPYIEDFTPDTFLSSEITDNYRAMLAYELDFTNKDTGWVRWLGKHRLLSFASQQDKESKIIRRRLAITSADADGTLRYLPSTLTAGWNYTGGIGASLRRFYYLASPGDAQARVSQSAGFWGNQGSASPYTGSINVYNWNTGQFQNDQVTESTVFTPAGSFKTQREIKTWKLSMQSYLWESRLVVTAGINHDDYRARITTPGIVQNANGTSTPALTNPQIYGANGLANEDLVMSRWNRWDELSGDTKTYGAVLRPFQGWGSIDRKADEGSVVSDIIRNLGFSYNWADNFNAPSTFQTDYFGKSLPKPTGEGRDFGVQVAMLNNKLVARLNWYEATNQSERAPQAGTLLTRLAYGDTTLMYNWATTVIRLRDGANPATSGWNDNAQNPLSDSQISRAWAMMSLPRDYYSGTSVGGTQNSKSKGMELQLTYNPLPNWTMKITGGKQFATYSQVAPEYDAWLAVRMPVWLAATATDIPDFVDGAGTSYSLRNFWQSYGYSSAARLTNTDGNTNAQNYFNNSVVSQVATTKALQGTAAPNLRKWTSSFLTNYVFTEGFARGFSVGGSQRYASKAIAGYFGKVGEPVLQPGIINVADVTRPIYSKADYTTDLWIGYTRKILKDKVTMKIKFNVNDVFESGGLEAFAYNFDGTPYAYRIVDPRQYILSTSFDF